MGNDITQARTVRGVIGLWLGAALAVIILLLPIPDSLVEITGNVDAATSAWVVLALIALMVVWWVSEAIPIPVTSMLPLLVLPLFTVKGLKPVAAEYFHPIVVLLLGGFIVAKAIEKWNLHERFALSILTRCGPNPAILIGGFMFASALLSMWISNTATAIMMMPIALSVARAVLGEREISHSFTYALLLGIAYACSIGGLGTPIGTPTNLIVIAYLNEQAGFAIGFLQWMLLGLPIVLILIPITWLVLTKWVFKIDLTVNGGSQLILQNRLAALGRLSTPEKRTLLVFAVIAALWLFRKPLQAITIGDTMAGGTPMQPLSGLSDAMIAILGVILCFVIPSGLNTSNEKQDKTTQQHSVALLDWKTAESIPWGVLLLFGGGMSLAGAISDTGLGHWIGVQMLGMSTLPIIVLIFVLTVFVIFATEVTSNVATASALMPVIGAAALAADIDVELLAIPLALAASCAFMLPMATGPNAVVYATGQVSLPLMARAGFRLNFIAIVIITSAASIAPSLLYKTLAFG